MNEENSTIDDKFTQKVIRRKKAYALINEGKTPVMVSEEEFLVPSQTDANKKYKVSNHAMWSCDCPDFQTRGAKNGVLCKHIQSIKVWLKIRNSFDVENITTNEEACPYCESVNLKKDGVRKNKNGEKQRWKCLDCKKRFVLEQIKYVKADGKKITLVMDLYFKGLSLRDISDHFEQFHNEKIHFDTIRRWIMKYTKIMEDYVDEKRADTSSRWHNDEQMIKVNGEWKWENNLIDAGTRFLLSNHLSKTRTTDDTRKLYQKGKAQANNLPAEIHTDGCGAYDRAVKKEFLTFKGKKDRPVHVRNVGIAKKENNNMIERYHNEFREFDKVRRGYKTDATAQEWNEGFRMYHNFIKKHMALNGVTPAQIANVELALGKNRWLGLLKQSLDNQNQNQKLPNTTGVLKTL